MKRSDFRKPSRRGVYYVVTVASALVSVALMLVLATIAPVAADIDITVEPAMTKGPTTAPVTIVEFSDYE